MKNIFIIVSLLFATPRLSAQTIEVQNVVCSGGKIRSAGQYQHIAVVGEAAVSRHSFHTGAFSGTIGYLNNKDSIAQTVVSVHDGASSVPALHLYPNPTDKTVTVQFHDLQATLMRVYDIRGVLLLTQNIEAGVSQVQIDLTHFASGVYILQVRMASGESIVQKLIRS